MKRLLFTLLAIVCGGFSLQAQDVVGDWYGTLEAGPSKLELVLHVSRSGNGLATLLDSPDQGASDIPLSFTSFENEELNIRDDNMMMTYTGKLEGQELQGTFTQGGVSFPLTFTRTPRLRLRPQTPEPPYPYIAEEVSFPNASAGITLAGTLTIPQGEGPFPAAVLITGSGAQNRDEELAGHRPFLVLADYLARNGIAVLRYDDRGFGSSGGEYQSADINDFASDAVSAMEYLRTRPEIEPGEIGLIGHSEGGMITYIIAAQGGDAAFIVSMAGPAVDGEKFMSEQRRLILGAMGMPESVYEESQKLSEAVIAVTDKYPLEFIRQNVDSLATTLVPADMQDNPRALDQLKAGLLQTTTPEMLSLLRYRPAAYLDKIECPVLAIVGERDLQVPPSTVEKPLREGVRPGTPLTVKVYPELNHLFQHAATGLPTEYGEIEETISPEVLADIAAWIREVTE